MGYSCTAKANYVMDALTKLICTGKCSNVFDDAKGQRYMFERGRENDDGAITGTVLRYLPNDYVRRCGSFRIEADGTIARFAGVSAKDRKAATENGLKRFHEVYGPNAQ